MGLRKRVKELELQMLRIQLDHFLEKEGFKKAEVSVRKDWNWDGGIYEVFEITVNDDILLYKYSLQGLWDEITDKTEFYKFQYNKLIKGE